MRIWTKRFLSLFCYYCVFVDGQLQISLKAINGDKTVKQDDNSKNQPIVLQYLAENETRRLSKEQVIYCFSFASLQFLLFNP